MTGTPYDPMIDRPKEGQGIRRLPVKIMKIRNLGMVLVPSRKEDAQLFLFAERRRTDE